MNDEIRMTNDECSNDGNDGGTLKRELRRGRYECFGHLNIGHLNLIRHSSFVIRHFSLGVLAQ